MQSVPGHAVCGAKTRSGKPCQSLPVLGSKRCRMHGGHALRGMANPAFKTGRYSEYIPERLLARYQEAASDTQLLELDHDIALVDARLSDLLGRADTGEAGKLWEKAQRANDDIRKALHNENYGGVMIASEELDRLIGDRLMDYQAWNEITSLLDQRRKLVESQRKRLIESQQMITSEQAMTFVVALTDIIRRNVTDRTTLNAISIEMSKLISVPAVAK